MRHLRGTDKPDMEGTHDRYLQLGMKLHAERGHFKTNEKMRMYKTLNYG
jgi:hypothetical protein